MTVASSTNRVDYTGNGATTIFPFTFRIFEASDIVVVTADDDGIETTLELNVDYTVTGVGSYNGGTVVIGTAPINGQALTIQRVLPLTQETDLRNQGQFFAETHEDVFDRMAMVHQQLQEQIDRAAKLPVTRTEDADSLVADIVLLADNQDNINIVAGGIGAVNTVADDIDDVSTVAGDIANINAVAGNETNINAVAANGANIAAVAGNQTNINIVANNTENINAAVADIPSLAAKVSKTGDTMTGDLRGAKAASDSLDLVGGASGTGNRIQIRGSAHPTTPNVMTLDLNGSEVLRFLGSNGYLGLGGVPLANLHIMHPSNSFARFQVGAYSPMVVGQDSNGDTYVQNNANASLRLGTNNIERHRIAADGSQSSVIPGGSTLLPEFKCRAWVNFNGTGTVAIRSSGNVSSITDLGIGNYQVNFTTAMPDANYSITYTLDADVDAVNQFSGSATPRVLYAQQDLQGAGSSRVFTGSNLPGGSLLVDMRAVRLAFFR
jgi:hypothetical protein